MSEPEEDPTPKIKEFIERLLQQGFVEVNLKHVVVKETTHRMMELALAGGIPSHQVSEFLEFGLEEKAPGYYCVAPHNIFTMLMELGIARDPEILQALTVHVDLPDGGWMDTFTDERGMFRLQFNPPDSYTGIIKSDEHPINWINVDLTILPGESE